MKLFSLISLIGILSFAANNAFSQTTMFGQLTGNPVNTTGWNLTGSALVIGDEIVLTPNVNNQAGTIYYDKAINLGLCPQFTVEFEFRMNDGNSADGMAFCFLDQAPSGFVVGNVLGIPHTANGLKVAIDTYRNETACTAKVPSIKVLLGNNIYDECSPDIIASRDNAGSGNGDMWYMRGPSYNKARIIYNNGNLQVWVDKPGPIWNPTPVPTQYINVTMATPINYAGYFGFSASTGGLDDRHSIRNVKIYNNSVPSIAGTDVSSCSNEANVIGSNPNAAYTYAWSPASGLNQANIANPTATIANTSGAAVTNQYIVTTYATATGSSCLSKDTIQITTNPTFATTQAASFCIGDSYTMAGQTFTTPGTHTIALQSQFTCDSIITLNLTANPAPTSTLNQTICNEDSFLFNGTSYNSTGTYYATFPTSTGCDSVATLNLTVRPAISLTDPVTICQGDNYSFGGSTYSNAGTYMHTFSGVNGCDSLVTLQLAVIPGYTSTINPVICQGDNYVFDGQSYTTAGTHVATFQSVIGCDSVVTMNLTVKPTYNEVLNQSICQGLTYTFDGQVYSTTGTYTANLQSVSGCDSTVTLNLTVSSSITNTLNESICQGDTYNFNSQNLTTAGTYTGTFISVGGCDSIVTLNLVVLPSQTITLNESICQGEIYTLDGIPYSTPGTYVANLQSIAGCDSIVTLNLLVNPIPDMPAITSNSPLGCPGEVFNAQVVNPELTGTYFWQGPNNYSAQGETISFTTSGASVGTYQVVLQQDGCDSDPETTILFIAGAEVTDFDFPNVISPNGDMINDFLDVDQFFNLCVNYELSIWNRWGNLIYTQKFGEKPFSGYDLSGKKVTPGVYFYKLTYEGEERHGSISVMY